MVEQKPTVSIIVPVYNEERIIAVALNHLLGLGANEVIVVDGGSTDGTFEMICRGFPSVRCLQTGYPGRAHQMNAGAVEASSDILLFVPADMRLPDKAVSLIQGCIQRDFIGGGFWKSYVPSSWLLSFYGFFLNVIYLSCLRRLVGSNGIFVTRPAFQYLGGFPEMPFLEDVAFSRALLRRGKLAVIHERASVSSRRYQGCGIFRQILCNLHILAAYQWFHVRPDRLKMIYEACTDKKKNRSFFRQASGSRTS